MTLELENQWFLRMTFGGNDGRRRELSMSQDILRDIQITESIDQIVPTFKMIYNQKIPAFQDDEPLTSPVPAKVSIGKTSKDKSRTEDYYLTFQRPHESAKGSSRRPSLVIRGFGSSIMDLMESPRRSFSSMTNAINTVSESVSAPIESRNFSNIDPKVNNSSYIQPGFSNSAMMRYLQKKAISSSGWSGYRYWINRLQEGHFETLNSLSSQSSEETFIHASVDGDERKVVADFEWILDSRESMTAGGFGHESSMWEWEDGSYSLDSSGPEEAWNDVSHAKLADSSLIKQREALNSGQKNYNQRGKQPQAGEASLRTESESLSQPISEMYNTQGVKITLRGRTEAVPGDVVDLVITDPSMTGKKQQVPSGKWLMHTKTEGIQREIVTRAILIRDSHNRKRS